MMIVNVALNAFAAVVGGLAAASLTCCLGWQLFKLIRHPEWGPPLCLLAALAIGRGALIRHDLTALALLFGLLFAMFAWGEGRAWRIRHSLDGG